MKKIQANSVANDDQDSAWKELLDECLPDFLDFFFPSLGRAIDWTRRFEPLDKELARIKPGALGGKLYADKLYKVWLKNGRAKWILIHIEVQGRAGRVFVRRVFDYHCRISLKYPGADVVSLAVITETKHPVSGCYVKSAFGCSLEFTFPLAQLARYAQRLGELEKHPNPFALAVAVQLKALETRGDNQRRADWKEAFIIGLRRRRYPRRKIDVLLRFMDEAMRLPEVLEQEVRTRIRQIEKGTNMPYVTSWERMAKQEGKQEALLSSLTLLLSHQFGELSGALQAKLQKLSSTQLESLFIAALEFESKSEVNAWLKQHANGGSEQHNGKHAKKKSQ